MDREKRRRLCLFSGIAVICAVFFIYLAFSLFFIRHYYFGTMIGSIDCAGRTVKEVESLIEERAAGYELTVQGREETEATLTASEIGVQFLLDDTLETIMGNQNGFFWFSCLWRQDNYDMPVTVSYEEEHLAARLQDMLMFRTSNMRKPVNAYIGEYDQESGSYQIVEEDEGTYLDTQKAEEAVVHAIEDMEEVLDLDSAGCYTEPDIKSDDDALTAFCARLNRYVSSEIVYDWHGFTEIVNGDLIQEWLDIDRDNQTVTIDSEAVREYINGLSRGYDTFGSIRQFTTSYGKEIYLEPGSYGWRVNRAKETERLVKAIRAGRQEVREPEYLYTAAAGGEDDIGDSYVEINLSSQHLYLYVEGELVTESDFVSGNVSRGFSTPCGVYGLTYKTTDAILKGEGYATPVDYWMPFNGNVGMHDAKWRREFGGNIYLKNGSHGCINLPLEAAEEIYGYVYKGFPVICYTDDDAENDSPGGESEKEAAADGTSDNEADAAENASGNGDGAASGSGLDDGDNAASDGVADNGNDTASDGAVNDGSGEGEASGDGTGVSGDSASDAAGSGEPDDITVDMTWENVEQ